MTERTDHLTDEAITQFLRTRSADPDAGLLDEITRAVGAAPQDRPWLGLRPVPVARRTVLLFVAALLAATTGAIAVGSGLLPPNPGGGSFEGVWISTSDTDGGTQTMTVRVSADGAVEIVVRDDLATVCSFTPSTMTGSGRIEDGTQLVIPEPMYACDDGSEPETEGGPPLEERLRNWTLFLDAETDTLSDGVGGVWLREGAEDPSPEPVLSGGMWPQTSLEEVGQAQQLADAGDPDFTWQLDPAIAGGDPAKAEIVARFLREELGWEEFLFNGNVGWDQVDRNLFYLRCAPGGTNPLYPDDEYAGNCAPTIDELRYETVRLDLAQPVRSDGSGIWVVSRWATAAPFAQSDPRIVEDRATALLQDFLEARIAGEGAEGFVDVGGQRVFGTLDEVPLLYGTSTGAPYGRYEIDGMGGPSWPYGDLDFDVRLFADGDETVVEQPFTWRDSRLFHDVTETTENGQSLALAFSFFDGEVILTAAGPWEGGFERDSLDLSGQADEAIVLVRDPLSAAPGCESRPAVADADALARSLESDPDLQVTVPVAVSLGGVDGLQMDVVLAPGASDCEGGSVLRLADGSDRRGANVHRGSRMRLYMLDMPEGSATRILGIAIVAPESRFEQVLEEAAPIVDSVEFQAQ